MFAQTDQEYDQEIYKKPMFYWYKSTIVHEHNVFFTPRSYSFYIYQVNHVTKRFFDSKEG